jgi:cysteine desulfurase/selenocysteine lyase
MEHHSNIVPWQLLCEERGAVLRAVPINDKGELIWEEYEKLVGPRTKLVAVVHLSNSLGTINPVRQMIELAHQRGARTLVDGAQSVSRLRIDVQELDCDFFVFSGHKIYGPTGIGVLYGKADLLEAMPPYQGGGTMIRNVTIAKTTYADLPNKFEAGTPHIAGAVGLGVALNYLESLGIENVTAHEELLLRRARKRLIDLAGVRLIGDAAEHAGVLSFIVEEPPVSSLDIGTRLDLEGIAVRTGHHCCQPVMDRFAIPSTTRASFGVYNTAEEVDAFADALSEIIAQARAREKTTVAPEGPVYPRAAAASPQAAADEIAEVFDFLENWTERYQYLIELGEDLPGLPNACRTEANRVRGCQSTVFFSLRKRPATTDIVEFLGDSDADIVRGLIGVLQRVYSGQRAADIVHFDIEGFFARLGLDQHLSMGRRNGLAAMVQRIRNFSATLAPTPK